MNVSIKSFDVEMNVKNKGVEFQVSDPAGKFLGDCIVTKTGLTWYKGKTRPPNGKKIKWDDFIALLEKQPRTKKNNS